MALISPGFLLCLDDGNVPADALVVLGGGFGDRAERAAELFHSGAAPRIIVSGNGDCTNNQRILLRAGVPVSAIELECDSRNTRENARFTIALLRKRGIRKAIIVTSWFHSRRALACFRHDAPEIQFFSRPSYHGYQKMGWSFGELGHWIRMEYVKLAGYWLRYGIAPF